MSTEVKLRRGTSTEHETFTGASAELTVDTTEQELVLHDGVTPGGKRVGIDKVKAVNSVADLAGFDGTKDDQQISLKGWHPDSDVGGGILYWDAARPKSEHNGGTVFSPTVPFSNDEAIYNAGTGETEPSGSGCWVRVDVGNTDASMSGNSAYEPAEISDVNLVDSTGWLLGDNWSGNYNTGFTHSTGLTDELTRTIAISSGAFYEVTIRSVSPSNSLASNSGWEISLGGSPHFEMYEGNFTDHVYKRGIKAGAGSTFSIKPMSGFNGTLSEITIKEITGSMLPITSYKDESGVPSLELKATPTALENTFIGISNATKNTTGWASVGIGMEALRDNTTGFWNVAVGRHALRFNTLGSRNVALGYIALRNNETGDRNIAIGSFSLLDNVSGRNNIGLGADVLQRNIDGSNNVAIGLGNLSGSLATSIEGNVAVGYACMPSCGTNYNVGLGFEASNKLTTGTEQIAIGTKALRENKTGSRNIVIGHNSLKSVAADAPLRNVIIGTNACTSAGNIQYNTIVGNNAAASLTTGDFNIILGYNVDTYSATDDYQLNIGNLIHGRMQASVRRVGIDVTSPLARLHLPAGKSTTFGAPLRFDSGVLMSTPEAGAFETDGTDLYFTNDALVRKKITLT